MVNDAQNDLQGRARPVVGESTGTWGGPRKRNWEKSGKRAVMMLHPSVYSFVDMVAHNTKRTKRTLLVQIFLEGLRSIFGVTARELSQNDYGCASKMSNKPLATVEQLREWSKTLTVTPYLEEEAQEEEA